MPVAVIVLLRRARSREWFEIALQDREERRAFSLARMIRWRRDDGQTAVEYAGLVAVVAAIIVALSLGGLRVPNCSRGPRTASRSEAGRDHGMVQDEAPEGNDGLPGLMTPAPREAAGTATESDLWTPTCCPLPCASCHRLGTI